MQVLVWVGWLLKFGRPKLFKTHTPMELPQGLRSTSGIWYPEGCLKKHHQPQNQADQESQFLRVHRLSGNRLRRRQRQRGLGFGLRVVLATLGPDGAQIPQMAVQLPLPPQQDASTSNRASKAREGILGILSEYILDVMGAGPIRCLAACPSICASLCLF